MDHSRAPLTTITRLPTAAGSRGILIYNSSGGAEKADTNRNPAETKTSNVWKEGKKKRNSAARSSQSYRTPLETFISSGYGDERRRQTVMGRVVTMELVLIKKQQCKYVQVLTEPRQISTQKWPWTPEECSLEPSSGGGGDGGQGHHCDTRSIYGKMLRGKRCSFHQTKSQSPSYPTVSIISK